MGVRIEFGQLDDLLGRCKVAWVRLADGEAGYDAGAVLPQEPWQPLTPYDAEQFLADDTTSASARIELVCRPLPPFLPDSEAARLEAAARLDPLPGRWPADLLGCSVSPGDRVTTTEDSSTRLRIGLHVDNFDRLPYARRHKGRRRLCLNLGPGPRYLLIGDRDVQQICRAMHIDVERHYPHTDDVRRYVADGRPLRCVRIRLEPGEGYIAPTELLPHDGSTTGIEQPSVAAFWLGPPSRSQ